MATIPYRHTAIPPHYQKSKSVAQSNMNVEEDTWIRVEETVRRIPRDLRNKSEYKWRIESTVKRSTIHKDFVDAVLCFSSLGSFGIESNKLGI